MATNVVGTSGTGLGREGSETMSPGRGDATRGTTSGRDRERWARIAAVATLVALPLLVYGLPAALGHLVVPGDDLTQNLPLRELVGRDLRAGQLPVFDPYLWSGTPLLAGWNAGAAYPLTWLFAVLPGALAWTVNLVAVGVAAGIGCYAFLRASGLRVLASWAGAMTFTYGGGMVAQVSHVGLVTGMSWVPLALLALLRLTDAGTNAWRSRLRWCAVLGVSVGLVLLSGEPRAITDAAAVVGLYGVWRIVRRWRTPASGIAAAACGVIGGIGLGIGLGAVQLVPGLAAVATSQRAQVTRFLFGAGSLPLHWLALLGVPDLLGGSGSFGQPAFFARYNLTEVTGYVGLLPLVGACALFARLRRGRPLPEWLVWEVVAVVGVLLALGDNTPLAHVLIHIPLVGGQRLQSRAILVSDLALAVLLAYWLDGWARRPALRTAPTLEEPPGRAERVLGSLPALCVAGLAVADLAAGAAFAEWMGLRASTASHAAALGPWLVPSLVLAAGALALVVAGPRLTPAGRGRVAAAFVLVDLVVFNVTTVVSIGSDTGTSPTVASAAPLAAGPSARHATERRSPRVRPIATLHLRGRFAVYDPGRLFVPELTVLGVPDASTIARTWSVQGYGSIVDGHYAETTGVHGISGTGQNVFAPLAAADGVFDSLSTQALLAPSQYLRTPSHGATDSAGAPGHAGSPGARPLAPRTRATWFLGAPLALRSAHVEIDVRSAASDTGDATVRVGLLRPGGTVDWATVRPAGGGRGTATVGRVREWSAAWPSSTEAVGLVVESQVRALAAAPVVTDESGDAYELDGVLQRAVVAPHWRYDGQDGAFAVFDDRRAKAPLSLRALRGGTIAGASVRRLSGPSLEPDSAVVSSPHGVGVVRAVAAVPGWTASWTPATRVGHAHPTATPLVVRRLGVVQLVRVPPGHGVLTWRYVAPGLLSGAVVSAASLFILGALLVGAAVSRRRKGRRAA